MILTPFLTAQNLPLLTLFYTWYKFVSDASKTTVFKFSALLSTNLSIVICMLALHSFVLKRHKLMNNCYTGNTFKKIVHSWSKLKKKIVGDWIRYENKVSCANWQLGNPVEHTFISPFFQKFNRNWVETQQIHLISSLIHVFYIKKK